ncbi:hypothetical protein KVR01_006481 [Diaporthe batatas]|uniref:uncharacterized protein n=1 Tax=Diaporthe batatas TaxID=748121 RepID=UPI001D0515E5|nr:uncharacterized protein KVR01_006481 [Diaporthe batatas]KAG8164563.1 hypothetical protein KVR01_006481 [Diaporthe batatas]
MCQQEVADLLCSEPECNNVLACKRLVPGTQERCEAVKNAARDAPQPPQHDHPTDYDIPRSQQPVPVYAQPRDWCRDIRSIPGAARKARTEMCRACRVKPVEEQNEMYADYGEVLAESRGEQLARDEERRARSRGEGPAAGGYFQAGVGGTPPGSGSGAHLKTDHGRGGRGGGSGRGHHKGQGRGS